MELLLWAEVRTKADLEADARAYKPGDVVDLHLDGWGWSLIERTDRRFRILRLTRITDPADLAPLLEEEWSLPKALAHDRGRLMRKRRAFVDLPRLPLAVRTWWQDDLRAVPIFQSNVSRAAVIAAIAQKAPRPVGAQKFRPALPLDSTGPVGR